MQTVDPLFAGDPYRTEVLISDKAAEQLDNWKAEGVRFLKKLEYFARAGFRGFEGKKSAIRHEWDGVWRIRYSDSSLLRLIGFYEDDRKARFIVIDAFKKRGQQLSSAQRDRIDEAAKTKGDNLWKVKKS